MCTVCRDFHPDWPLCGRKSRCRSRKRDPGVTAGGFRPVAVKANPDGMAGCRREHCGHARSRGVSRSLPIMSSFASRKTFRVCAIAAGLLASGVALADAQLDPQLLSRMAAAGAADELQVVISYEQSAPVTAGQVAALNALGITKGVTMRTLPIAGALATPAEIRALAQRDDVASIYFNAPLRYFNKEAREISGAARAVQNPADYGRAIPFSGAGITVLVNDSGVDGTHDDIKFGDHLVQNTQGVTNLAAVDAMLPITYLEGVPNTDWGSGHGTHCAGTIGGTGAKSNGLYRGAAPGADLVGYGSGAVLLILDAVEI